MIEALKDFPDNISAFACHEHLTRADYETVIIPADRRQTDSAQKAAGLTLRSRPTYAGVEPDTVWEDTSSASALVRLGTRRAGH